MEFQATFWRLPNGLKKECKKTRKILEAFLKEVKGDFTGPTELKETERDFCHKHLSYAAGIIVIRFLKVAFIGSMRYGNGLMFARLPNGKWSAPACVETAGIGFGASFGISITNEVFFMNEAAVKAFKKGGNITIGGDVQLTLFSLGRGLEADVALGKTRQGAQIYSFSKSAGLYGAVQVQTGGIFDRRKDNQKYYGDNVNIKDILDGHVIANEEDVEKLYTILNSGEYGPDVIASSSSDEQHITTNEFPSYPAPMPPSHPSPYTLPTQPPPPQDIPPHPPCSLPTQVAPPPPPPPPPPPINYPSQNLLPTQPPPPQDIPPHPQYPLPTQVSPPPPPSGQEYWAAYDFCETKPGELSFKAGEKVIVLAYNSDNWWTVRSSTSGKQGIVPANFLVPE